ncbi:MAG: hypothetical protein RBT34_01875 [Anaerolineaceae bacterium]|nr:hypothetical protein [Anaerolineaceae bacterium]
MSKMLVLYYSFEGTTQRIAELIAGKIDADIAEVKPVKEIKTKGFFKYVLGGGQVVLKIKPELKPLKVNLDDYETILLGSPIWAGTFTPPILTLLERGYLKNKTIAYFYCHKGGADQAEEKAKAVIEKNNAYLSSFGCMNVPENFESLQAPVIAWAKRVISKPSSAFE